MDDVTAQSALVGQLQTKGANSKKFRMVVMGLISVLIVFFACAAVMLRKPEVAGSIASLAQIVVGAISGMIAIYCGSQAWAETTTTNALSKK